MEKLNYNSLYKFIVSIGIGIMVLPFIFLFGILNNNEFVIIKESEINQLTNTAKAIIYLEQNYKYAVLSNPVVILIIVIIFIIIGLIIVIYGVIQWNNKVQKHEDKNRELSNKILEHKLSELSNEEKEQKMIKDIETLETDNKPKATKTNLNKQKITKYMEMQKAVYKIIRKQFSEYKIFEETRLGKQMYDCIALPISRNALYDYIFEIKYFTTINSIKGRIEKLESMMLEQELIYYKNSDRYSKVILILIVENFSDEEKFKNKKFLNENSLNKQIIIGDLSTIKQEIKKINKL